MDRMTPGEGNGSPGSSLFDATRMALYARIRKDLAVGNDVTLAIAELLRGFETGLERLSQQCDGGGPALAALQVQKRVVYEVLQDLVRKTELGPSAQPLVTRLLAQSSWYDQLPHPRYRITQDWFSHNVPIWRDVLASLVGKPNVCCLEIGSFEGLSACWFLENVLTHDTSRIVCVDPFDSSGQPQAERYFDHNVRQSGAPHKLSKLKGVSRQVIPLLSGSSFDIAYIDGSHDPSDTLVDALLVWPLLRPQGVMIFDDYAIGDAYPRELVGSVDPKPGIDAFLAFTNGQHEVVSRAWQLIVVKGASHPG